MLIMILWANHIVRAVFVSVWLWFWWFFMRHSTTYIPRIHPFKCHTPKKRNKTKKTQRPKPIIIYLIWFHFALTMWLKGEQWDFIHLMFDIIIIRVCRFTSLNETAADALITQSHRLKQNSDTEINKQYFWSHVLSFRFFSLWFLYSFIDMSRVLCQQFLLLFRFFFRNHKKNFPSAFEQRCFFSPFLAVFKVEFWSYSFDLSSKQKRKKKTKTN